MKKKREPTVIGWREWVSLPDLGVEEIKAKIDTGARSSALHAYDIEYVRRDGGDFVRFSILPYQRTSKTEIQTEATLFEMRKVRSSSGHVEERPVIETVVAIGDKRFRAEITLTSRDEMGFRMLLGRQAVRGTVLVDPGRSYIQSRPRGRKRP